MGRDPMYNVRCVVSGFGFAPSNTGYIGTMGAGTSATTKIELYIIALNAAREMKMAVSMVIQLVQLL